jgi:hypothetical protein
MLHSQVVYSRIRLGYDSEGNGRMATIRELKSHIDLKELYSNSLAHIT